MSGGEFKAWLARAAQEGGGDTTSEGVLVKCVAPWGGSGQPEAGSWNRARTARGPNQI